MEDGEVHMAVVGDQGVGVNLLRDVREKCSLEHIDFLNGKENEDVSIA